MSSVAPASTTVPIHTASTAGYSHAANVLYDTGRPAYADEAVDFLLHTSVLNGLLQEFSKAGESTAAQPASSSSWSPRVIRLVDVGAGTGIFTRCLLRRVQAFESVHREDLARLGVQFEVSAIEPVEGMRQRFHECCPQELRAFEGSGSSMPSLATGSVDVLFAAQSFHWFATPESLAEIARVLRTDRPSFFSLIWNNRDLRVGWIAELEKIITPRYGPDVPRQQSGEWKRVMQAHTHLLQPFAERSWPDAIAQQGDENMVLARVLSISVISSLPQSEQDVVANDVRNLLRTHPDTKDLKGQYHIPYVTDAFVYKRVGSGSFSSSTAVAAADSSLSPLSRASWLNEPKFWSIDASRGSLTFSCEPQSDFWNQTHYGFTRSSGHVFAVRTGAGFTSSVHFRARLSHQYDQAGLMVRLDGENWIKAGVELSDGKPMVSSVLTTNARSDWATAPLENFRSTQQQQQGQQQSQSSAHDVDVRVRITVAAGVVRVQVSTDGGRTFALVRLAPFSLAESYLCGPYSCTPDRQEGQEKLSVTFDEFTVTKPLGKDLHDLS